MGMGRYETCDIESKLMEWIDYVESTYKERQLTAAAASPTHTLESRSSMNCIVDETCKEEMPRYLFVSNGCEICLLDLKQDAINPKQQQTLIHGLTDQDDCTPLIINNNIVDVVPPLPKTATLNLIEEQLPVSVGLFKLGSHAYMIGGQEYPPNLRVGPVCTYGKAKPSSLDLYTALVTNHNRPCTGHAGINIGTSRAWYRLSVADNGCTLSASAECNNIIEDMKRPKICPIVEEIDGEIHVFDSAPFYHAFPRSDWVFSHEVLKLKCKRKRDGGFFCWDEIQTSGDLVDYFIKSHLVLGHCIYAVCVWDNKCLLFDSRKRKWEACGRTRRSCSLDQYSWETAWDIISYATNARCVLDLEVGGNQFYVVIALGGDGVARATACLVNSAGKVVCTQFLHYFFDSTLEHDPVPAATSTVILRTMRSARILKVDKDGKTMCAVFRGVGYVKLRPPYTCLFITTFSVKMLPGAASRYGMGEGPSSGEFVHVDIKNRLVYDINAADENRRSPHFHDLQACFL